jgi:hypothetical protein
MKFSKEQFFQDNQKEEDNNLIQSPSGLFFCAKKRSSHKPLLYRTTKT